MRRVAVAALTVTAVLSAGGAAASPAGAVRTAPKCGSGAEQVTVINNSGYPDKRVYGAITWNTTGTATPARLVNHSLPLQGSYPSAGAPHRYFFCLVSGAGRLWLSLGSPITSNFAAGVQPSPATAPYRFGIVEFAYPSAAASLDTSYVNNFDFPINVDTYTRAGGSRPAQRSDFTANTCQIVNAVRRGMRAAGSSAKFSKVEFNQHRKFVRIIAPDTQTSGWPDMAAYIRSLAASLPVVSSGPFKGTHGPIVINDLYGGDPGTAANQGWFKAEAFFDARGDMTIDAGHLVAGLGGGGKNPSGPYPNTIPDDLTVKAATLATGIYQQGFTYGLGNGNDIYAWWWGDVTTAFDYGYWQSLYGNDSINFSKPAGLASTAGKGQPAFAPKRTVSYPSVAGGLGYNLYAAVLSRYSPSYTFPYNERWGRGGLGTSPLLNMPTGGEVRVTVPADGWSSGKSGSKTCKK